MSKIEINNLPESIINSINAYIFLMDLDGKIIYGNDMVAKAMGFKSRDEIIGLTYADQRCKAAEHSEIFSSQNKLAIERNEMVYILSYDCYADGEWKIIMGSKTPCYNDKKEQIGVTVTLFDMTDIKLIDIGQFLIKTDNINSSDLSFNYIVEKQDCKYNLSTRELECLFFTLRGKTAKEIAKILAISSKTVEAYLASIKSKMSCNFKSELIEKAYFERYMNVFPHSLLNNKNFLKLTKKTY